MAIHPPRASVVAVLAIVGTLSWLTRELAHQRIPVFGRDTWITSDMDTMYQCRRVDRLLQEGRVDGRDPYLSFPDGSAIPWPPYYTWLVGAWTAPGAPTDPDDRRAWIERRVASLPRAFGVATSLVVALGTMTLAGPVAALLAGSSHALSGASISTSRVGNGDHHAFIALLSLVLWVLASRALRPGALDDRPRSALRGACVGLVAGVALGTWVASLIQIVLLQAALGIMLLRRTRRDHPGLAAFGLAAHLAALAAVLPAVAVSPWNVDQPWGVVNLTWFHALWLGLGALVFLPLLATLPPRVARAYPAIVALGIVALAGTAFALNVGPATGIRRGFSWLGRSEAFMSVVGESRSLFQFHPVAVLGRLVYLLPIAWVACVWHAFRRGRTDLLPWAVAVPALFAQAAQQARFADLLAGPMAIVVAWFLAAAWRSDAASRVRHVLVRVGPARGPVAGSLALIMACAAHAETAIYTWNARDRDPTEPGIEISLPEGLLRQFAEWIRVDTAGAPRDFSVLANWSWGHVLEWVADCPTVATNFGSYVGDDAFREPARFFMSEDPAEAEAILERRRSRFVVATTLLPRETPVLAYLDGGRDATQYVKINGGSFTLFPSWYRTMGARLLFDGGILRSGGFTAEPLDFLRLVKLCPVNDPQFTMRPTPTRAGSLWERVAGARVEGRGTPGEELRLGIVVSYPPGNYHLTWTGVAVADESGLVRLRVPYATDQLNGEGRTEGRAVWRFGARSGQLEIPTRAVLEGGAVSLPDG